LPLRFPSEDAQHRRASSPTTTQPSPTIARARSLCQATATTGMLISEKCQSAQDYYRADPENQQRQNDECVRPTQFRIGPGNDRTGSSDQLGPHEVLTHIVQLNPEEMVGRLTRVYERNLTTTVANLEHIESTTVNGDAIVKIFLQPNARLQTANARLRQFRRPSCASWRPEPCHRADHPFHQFERADSARTHARDFRSSSTQREQSTGVSARSDAISISQPLIHNILQRFALLKPAILPQKQAHRLILPVGCVVRAVRRQQNILQLVQQTSRRQRFVLKDI